MSDDHSPAHASEKFGGDVCEGRSALDLGVRDAMDEGRTDVTAFGIDQCRELVLNLATGINAGNRHFDDPIGSGRQSGCFEVDHGIRTAVFYPPTNGSASVLE